MSELNQKGFDEAQSYISIFEYVEIIFRYRLFLVIWVSVPSMIMLIYLLFFSIPFYQASATILPRGLDSGGGLPTTLQSVANFSGINLQSEGSQLFGYYSEILKSRKIISQLLNREFTLRKFQKQRKLIDLMEIDGIDENTRFSRAIEKFQSQYLNIEHDSKKGILYVRVEFWEPALAAAITDTIIYLLDQYTRSVSMRKAQENLAFIESRIVETSNQLIYSEELLKQFRKTNKRIESSPELQLEGARLLREVKVQEEVFISLKRENELSKIEAVKNLPTLEVLDSAQIPLKKSKPQRMLIMFAVFGFSLVTGSGGVLIWHYSGIRGTRKRILSLLLELRSDWSRIMNRFKSIN